MCRPPSSGCVRRRACGLPYPASGRRSRSSLEPHVYFLTGAPRRRFTRPSLPRPAASDGGRGEAVIPRPVVRGPMTAVLTRSRSPILPPANLGVPLPTMLIVRRRRWGPVIGRERRRVRPVIAPSPLCAPAGDPTPITPVKVRTRAKSTTGFHFPNQFPDLNPATGLPVAV